MKPNPLLTNTFVILSLAGLLALSGCSEKPSSEEIAAQVKAAMAEEKAKEQAAAPAPAIEDAAPAPAPRPVPKPVEKSKPAAPASTAITAPAAPVVHSAPAPKVLCANCGEVVSVTAIEQEGKGSGVGVIAGALGGGVLANQVGQGRGKDLATIAGVVGGAIAGNKIEKTMKKTTVYDVKVRLENGEERVLRHVTPPGVSAGDKVKVEADHAIKQ